MDHPTGAHQLACGDALGRPIAFTLGGEIAQQYSTTTGMFPDETDGNLTWTVIDDTEMTPFGITESVFAPIYTRSLALDSK